MNYLKVLPLCGLAAMQLCAMELPDANNNNQSAQQNFGVGYFSESLKPANVSSSAWREFNHRLYDLLKTPDKVIQFDGYIKSNLNTCFKQIKPMCGRTVVEKWHGVAGLNDTNSVLIPSSDDPKKEKLSTNKQMGVVYEHTEENDPVVVCKQYAENASNAEPQRKRERKVPGNFEIVATAINDSGDLVAVADYPLNTIYLGSPKDRRDFDKQVHISHADCTHTMAKKEFYAHLDDYSYWGKIMGLVFVSKSILAVRSPNTISLLDTDALVVNNLGFHNPPVCFTAPLKGSGFTTNGVEYHYRLCPEGLVNLYHNRLYEYPLNYETDNLSDTQKLYTWAVGNLANLKEKKFDTESAMNALYHHPALTTFEECVQRTYKNIITKESNRLAITISPYSPYPQSNDGSCILV